MAIWMSREREDGTRDCFVSGTVTRDTKLDVTKNKGMPKVTFSVNCGNKRYINCLALGDGDVTRLAACLERRDTVFGAGTFSTRAYTSRDGSEKQWSELLLDFLSVQSGTPASQEPDKPEEEAPESEPDYAGEDDYDYQPTV